jgi:hypothetical protein
MITQARHFLERSDAFLNAHEIITGVTQKIYSYEDLLGDPTPYFDWAAVARGIEIVSDQRRNMRSNAMFKSKSGSLGFTLKQT